MLKIALIVEDEPELSERIISLLHRNAPAAMSFQVVRSVQAAQRWLKDNAAFLLLIIDMVLPADEDAARQRDELEQRLSSVLVRARNASRGGENAAPFWREATSIESELQNLVDPVGGLRILRWLADRSPGGRITMPVIVTTAGFAQDRYAPFVAEQCLRCIPKPFSAEALLAAIREMLPLSG